MIDLFASASAREYNGRTGLDVASIMEALEMEEELVQDAVGFWLNKTVLYEPSPGVYAVLERLDMHIAASTQTHTRQEEALSAVVSQDAMLREGAPMFQTFIANMLRNQGSKQIGGMMGITNLLKMVLPTFTYGDDEVAWLLSEMEGRGEVVRSADLWSIA